MSACSVKVLEMYGIIDHVEDDAWNAHGNTATGAATSPLKIDAGTFWVDGDVGNTPTSGAGTRFMYIPSKKGAIRAGSVVGTEWDSSNIGDWSVAFGRDSEASGPTCIAAGKGCVADSGAGSATALGELCTASGYATVSIGYNNEVTSVGNFNVAIGSSNYNDASLASAIVGAGNSISGGGSATLIGLNNTTEVSDVLLVGQGNIGAVNAVCIGNRNTGGRNALSVGNDNIAFRNTFQIGQYCQSLAQRAHVIGTGRSSGTSVSNTDISCTAPDLIDSASSEFGVFSVGDIFVLSGSIYSGNNDLYTVAAGSTAAQIIVEEGGIITKTDAQMGTTTLDDSNLANNVGDSVFIGINSNVPTLVLTGGDGTSGSVGRLGVVYTAPLSTLDIGGSVAFAYTPIACTDGGTITLDATAYKYRFDITGMSGVGVYTVQLPEMGATTVDRRIYEIKITNKGGLAGPRSAVINVTPHANDQIESWGGGGGGIDGEPLPLLTPLPIGNGDGITIQANNDDGVWWVM